MGARIQRHRSGALAMLFGPVLGPDYSTSIVLVKRLMDGSVPGCPDTWFGGVDVRDVADLHLKYYGATVTVIPRNSARRAGPPS
jgi:hypothetical protein